MVSCVLSFFVSLIYHRNFPTVHWYRRILCHMLGGQKLGKKLILIKSLALVASNTPRGCYCFFFFFNLFINIFSGLIGSKKIIAPSWEVGNSHLAMCLFRRLFTPWLTRVDHSCVAVLRSHLSEMDCWPDSPFCF